MSEKNPYQLPLWGILVSNNNLEYAMSSQFPGSKIVTYYKYRELIGENWDFQ